MLKKIFFSRDDVKLLRMYGLSFLIPFPEVMGHCGLSMLYLSLIFHIIWLHWRTMTLFGCFLNIKFTRPHYILFVPKFLGPGKVAVLNSAYQTGICSVKY